ncbi:protein NRT1/ PTR FAMILY 4.5-like [Dioscorea cayenensis subsp. rotundata]|uniref:Protein NRT1/ PTR FAMILY 4.5-like n=1 Tax=Dioscorea cayennensis subsp. rotundata TaxID=55577 RepID=A0AB40AKT0_DIOCR|nr:protein NRT1/ PTR FAMILY 4.5-like [Dioscorea cayenensis subsp. rotundata]
MEKGVEVVEGKVDWKGRPAKKRVHGGTRSTFLILGLVVFDNFAVLGLSVNFVTYFTTVMHWDIATASSAVTSFMGTGYMLAVIGAFFADGFIGRSMISIISCWFYFMGLVLLTVQAHFPSLKPEPCNIYLQKCEEVKGGNAAFLYTSMYLVAAGMAGLKAGLPPHGADQFDENDPQEASHMSSFFNWLLLSICIGGSFSLTFAVWIQDNVGWDWGFAIACISIFLGTIIFVAGYPVYRFHVIQKNNPITEIIQVYVASIRNRNLQLPENPKDLYEIDEQDKESATHSEVEFQPHRDMYRCLDKAAIRTEQSPSPWKLCRVTQVEHAKTILAMLPIFASSILMSTCLAQLQTFSVQQGATMDTHIGSSFKIPAASLPIIPVAFLVIIVPVYDQLIVPFIRKFTGHPTGITHLQRIGVGLVLAFISMVVGALVEVKRKNVAKSHAMLDAVPIQQPLPISCFWLGFQFFIFGIADMFTYVGLLEFFYSEAPKQLKSIASSFLWCSLALGYFLNTILVELVNAVTKKFTRSGGWLAGNNLNRNHLNLFYWLLAFLCFFNFFNYLFWASRYKYKQETQPVFK